MNFIKTAFLTLIIISSLPLMGQEAPQRRTNPCTKLRTVLVFGLALVVGKTLYSYQSEPHIANLSDQYADALSVQRSPLIKSYCDEFPDALRCQHPLIPKRRCRSYNTDNGRKIGITVCKHKKK